LLLERILFDWTPTGVVIIKHKDELISVYKKLSFLTKGTRQCVLEVIGQARKRQFSKVIVVIFAFELWKKVSPNPTQFINFNNVF
jgi:hypothetical protein